MNITKGEDILTLVGTERNVGEKAPDFTLNNLEDQAISLGQLLTKPVLLNIVPDIDTRVCSIQTKRFNQEAASIEGAAFVTISKNTKEEQANWCAAEGVDMEMLHDTEFTFGRNYGLLIESLGLLARSVFVLDKDGTIVYREIVAELTDEPDYNAALTELRKLV
ncbi:thiol peroxidase [Vagococcus elongatus]|uniref:Lipid hydroperoxide peroxidase n=1 Tax=Vagococcus elongatus TaxID=180344 RepID=A0A430ARM8_9ENTE|nr:thiol peroxidase [Vagococcus elongatus]RSU10713.1 lipid hydroperoxide peroxidase [Vagococcus elongatus]